MSSFYYIGIVSTRVLHLYFIYTPSKGSN